MQERRFGGTDPNVEIRETFQWRGGAYRLTERSLSLPAETGASARSPETAVLAFYEARVPEGITNGADFEKWRREAERAQPRLLELRREDLMRHEAAGITTDNFPHELRVGPNAFALEYHFEPGSPKDGVTLTAPVALLNQVPAARCEWLVPGLLKEKVQAAAAVAPATREPLARDALLELGYSVVDAEWALDGIDPDLSVEEQVRLALRKAA